MIIDVKDRLTTQDFWVNTTTNFEFKKHEPGHGIDNFIQKYIPKNSSGTCIEIGSFPGSHLATFGELGYEVSGIDFHPLNKKDLPQWLHSIGIKTGEFTDQDFFSYQPHKQFDIVASFGFIEHFQDYQNVIDKHVDLVKDDGYIVITTPNFKGWIQKWLHKTFDSNNLKLHNLESMQPEVWKKLFEQKEFEVIYHGYFGGFWFWRSKQPLNKIKRTTLWFIERIIPRLRKILKFESPAFSAYAGIVARKIK